jgi:transcriptional regulator with XRE-family HTH domain
MHNVYSVPMTTTASAVEDGPTQPEWDRADVMRKALRHAGLSVHEIADYLGVARNTVSTWINGRIEPSTQTLRLWALRCDVPYEWLMSAAPNTGRNVLPRLDSNQQPSDNRQALATIIAFPKDRTPRRHRLREVSANPVWPMCAQERVA